MALGKHFPRVRLGTDLVAYYNLNVGFYTTGKVFDYSRKGHTGTVTGTSCLPKYPGFNFDGSKDYIEIADHADFTMATAHSFSVWVKRDITGHTEGIISKGGNGEYAAYVLNVSSANEIYYSESSSNVGPWVTIIGTIEIADTNWHHIVATSNFVTANLYLDGVLIGTETSPATSLWDNGADITIGAESKPSNGVVGRFFGGLIGEIMIYKKALTITEIKGLYRQTKRFYVR